MRKLYKILISLGTVGVLLSIPLFTHASGGSEIIIPYGAIYVQHASYQTTYLATTTTETGRGNTLMSAFNNAVCGDTIMVASSTYNIGQGVLDLTKQGTCTTNALSLIGIGMPTIKGSNTSGTGIYEIVQPGDGSVVQNLIIRALQVFPSNFGFPIYIASDNATIVIRNVKAYGNTDGIYAFNGNTGVNLTIDNFTGTCHWDCGTFDMPLSTTTITDSSFNIVTPPVTSGVLRPLFFARGTYYLNNVSAIGFGGTSRISSIQVDATAGAQDSVTMYSGVLSASGAATSYEIDNQGSGSVNIFSGVSRTVASTSGAVLFPDADSIVKSIRNAVINVGVGTSSPNSRLDVNGGFYVEAASSTVQSYDFCTSNNIITFAASSTNAKVTFTNGSKCYGKTVYFRVFSQPSGLIGSTTFLGGSGSGNVTFGGSGINPGNCVINNCTDLFLFTSWLATSSPDYIEEVLIDSQ